MGDMNAKHFTPEVLRFLRASRHYGSTWRGRLYNAMWFAGIPPRVLDHVMLSRALLEGVPFELDQASVAPHLYADTETVLELDVEGDELGAAACARPGSARADMNHALT
jgi:hypothetical protein